MKLLIARAMGPYLQNKFFVIGVLLLLSTACSVDHSPKSSANLLRQKQLVWTLRLPGEAGIYNDGLIGLPVVNDIVLFHSTIFTNQQEEDNRIHALNCRTGELLWTFPAAYDPQYPCFFGGKPYFYDSLLVVKMRAFHPYSDHDRIVVINIRDGSKHASIHFPAGMSSFTCSDVVGDNELVWFIQEDHSSSFIYNYNMQTGDTTKLVQLVAPHPGGIREVSTRELVLYNINGQNALLLGIVDYYSDHMDLSIILMDAASGNTILSMPVTGDADFLVNYALIKGNKLFYTCGRITACVDLTTGKEDWLTFFEGSLDRMMPGLIVQNELVFTWGHQLVSGLNAATGEIMYQHEYECANVSGKSPYFVLITYNGTALVINEHTGKTIVELHGLPVKEERIGFSYGCQPGINGQMLYLFGTFHAYCYQLEGNSSMEKASFPSKRHQSIIFNPLIYGGHKKVFNYLPHNLINKNNIYLSFNSFI